MGRARFHMKPGHPSRMNECQGQKPCTHLPGQLQEAVKWCFSVPSQRWQMGQVSLAGGTESWLAKVLCWWKPHRGDWLGRLRWCWLCGSLLSCILPLGRVRFLLLSKEAAWATDCTAPSNGSWCHPLVAYSLPCTSQDSERFTWVLTGHVWKVTGLGLRHLWYLGWLCH